MNASNGYSAFYFIDGDNSRHSDSMICAFKLLSKEGIGVSWKDEKQTKQLASNNQQNNCYVIESFDGRLFQFLQTCGVNILGPNCVIYCIQYNDTLIRRNYPVKSYCMKNVCVTTSGLSKQQRDDLSQKVLLMGGKFCNEITSKTTHIVSNNVMTKKCQRMRSKQLPILKTTWITDSYEKCHTSIFKATSSEFLKKYRLRIFQGATICVSQISNDKRNEVKKIVIDNGGIYNPALNLTITTHLILEEASGEKYNAAKNTGHIYILNINWLLDSIAKGQIQCEEQYLIDSCTNINSNECFDIIETHKICPQNQKDLPPPRTSNVEVEIENLIELSQLVNVGSELFDGYHIFLIGFDNMLLKKVQKLISINQGYIYNSAKDRVTHVIVGPYITKAELDDCKQKLPDIVPQKFLSFNWISECILKNKIVDSNGYCISHERDKSLASSVKFCFGNGVIPAKKLITEKNLNDSVTTSDQLLNDNELLSEYNDNSSKRKVVNTRNISVCETKPLAGCVITFSTIDAMEKEQLKEKAINLGALYQDFFSRRDVPPRNIKANTHLVVSKPIGEKFEKSLEWKIPCVSKEWLYKCSELKRKEKEEHYIFKCDVVENENLLLRLEGYKAEIGDGESQQIQARKSNPQTRNHFGDLVRQQINDERNYDSEMSASEDEIPVTWRKRDT